MSELEDTGTTPVAAPPLVPSLPTLDRGHLARMTLGNRSLEAEVLALFICQAELLLPRMLEAKPDCVGALAHTLKGSARGIGLWRVAALADALEQIARSSTGAAVADAVRDLTSAVAEARAAIAQLTQVA
ncbi:MAG: Hpt domain-containing protein [Xanthobacteraceae bacterium]